MSRTFHRWRRPPDEPLPPDGDETGRPGTWRCGKCGASLRSPVKPTRRSLRRSGLGETCEEWTVREVMAQ